ncbi:MAG TPA: class I SAM-dependent methyltransferase [Noviherbaspirillum sp.]|nr:class I SAM-dependent methyltransferase [Noviherbaspirillum sp.]
MTTFRRSILATVACAVALSSPAWAQTAAPAAPAYEPKVGQAGKDVIWVPTPQTVVDRMLEMAELKADDFLVDLGSGDGRTVITAAKRGVRAHGIEYNPDMVVLSKRAAEAEGVAGRATFEQADIFKSDFSHATVVTLFLLPQLNLRLRPTLLDMKPGTRVVSNSFTMDDWEPDESDEVKVGCPNYCSVYKWTVPAKVEGTWQLGNKQLVLTQTFQKLEGALREGGKATPISDARMDGARIIFTAGKERYAGEVDGRSMKGTINGRTAWSATRSN